MGKVLEPIFLKWEKSRIMIKKTVRKLVKGNWVKIDIYKG